MTNSTCNTTIRMGAAHYDLRMKVGEVEAYVNLAEVLHGMQPRERNSHLAGIAEIVCKSHGITLRDPPPAVPLVRKKKFEVKKVRKPLPLSMSMVLTREATL